MSHKIDFSDHKIEFSKLIVMAFCLHIATSFACASNFFIDKNTIEAIQTNSIFTLFIVKIIHCKVNFICQMCKIAEWFDCVIA